jgi:transcription elongation factor GreA
LQLRGWGGAVVGVAQSDRVTRCRADFLACFPLPAFRCLLSVACFPLPAFRLADPASPITVYFEVRSVQKFPMTAPGLQRLEEELKNLKSIERFAVIRAIAEARSHGDLSENAEYHAARERQSFIEGRIGELEEIVSAVEIIDPSQLTGDVVKFGAHVHVVDEETEKESTYQIVGVHEADIKQARLSISSPLAKALIGKKVGESISVPAPSGDRVYEILSVKFI